MVSGRGVDFLLMEKAHCKICHFEAKSVNICMLKALQKWCRFEPETINDLINLSKANICDSNAEIVKNMACFDIDKHAWLR